LEMDEDLYKTVDATYDTRLRLVVFTADGWNHAMPCEPGDSIVVGRSSTAGLCIPRQAVSRHHARLTVLDDSLRVEDLGSRNGTYVRARRLEAGAIDTVAVGDIIELPGEISLALQGHAHGTPASQLTLVSHEYFTGRLDEECRRSQAISGAFWVLRAVPAPGCGLQAALATHTRPTDVVGRDGVIYEVLFLDTVTQPAGPWAQALRTALGSRASVGLACYPDDGTSSEALIRAATPATSASFNVERPRGSTPMASVWRVIQRVAPSSITVLLQGETGVGKGYVAQKLHEHSGRNGPLVSVNCAALAPTLLESELFGHEAGAFTGAGKERGGLVEAAHNGTLLLDEIGDFPKHLQVKLLRVLEEREIVPVGGTKPRSVTARIVAATNRDMKSLMDRGMLRRDLFYRLTPFIVRIPPLRERIDEVPRLAQSFVEQACARDKHKAVALSADATAMLQSHDWPGNIRELKHVVERAVVLCTTDVIEAAHLSIDPNQDAAQLAPELPGGDPLADAPVDLESTGNEGAAPEDRELSKERLIGALEECGWHQSRAAHALGVHRRTVARMMQRLGIERPGHSKPTEGTDPSSPSEES
jgi:DNA-binding NtrC family response regulator